MKLFRTFIFSGAIILGSCSDHENSVKESDTLDSLSDWHDTKNVSCIYEPAPPQNVEYTVQFEDICEAPPHKVMTHVDIKQKGIRNPYNYNRKDTKDSLILSFEFLDVCCLEYDGDAYQKNDSLFIGFYLPNDSNKICDCTCNYRMTYRLKKDSVDWQSISVVRGYASSQKALCSFGSEFKLMEK